MQVLDAALTWAASAVGVSPHGITVTGLRDGGSPWRLQFFDDGGAVQAILRLGDHRNRDGFATEVAALTFAAQHQLAAPRVLAVDLDGAAAGRPAVLMTLLEGSTTIPLLPSPARLRTMGATAAQIHGIRRTSPTAALPLRTRPIPHDNYVEERRRVAHEQPTMVHETMALLMAAADRIETVPTPESELVFVHGDLWQGNMLWRGDVCCGVVDWDSAGVGHYGVDLGSLRLDAALMYGLALADLVVDGWHQVTKRVPEHVAYWDIVAALNTPANMEGFVPAIHGQGRRDLDGVTLTARRDMFLRAGLAALDHRS